MMASRAYSPSISPHCGSTARHSHEYGIYRATLAGFERRKGLLCIEKNWSRLTMVLTPRASPILTKKRQFPIKIDDHAHAAMWAA